MKFQLGIYNCRWYWPEWGVECYGAQREAKISRSLRPIGARSPMSDLAQTSQGAKSLLLLLIHRYLPFRSRPYSRRTLLPCKCSQLASQPAKLLSRRSNHSPTSGTIATIGDLPKFAYTSCSSFGTMSASSWWSFIRTRIVWTAAEGESAANCRDMPPRFIILWRMIGDDITFLAWPARTLSLSHHVSIRKTRPEMHDLIRSATFSVQSRAFAKCLHNRSSFGDVKY